jgi:hypothetical protein
MPWHVSHPSLIIRNPDQVPASLKARSCRTVGTGGEEHPPMTRPKTSRPGWTPEVAFGHFPLIPHASSKTWLSNPSADESNVSQRLPSRFEVQFKDSYTIWLRTGRSDVQQLQSAEQLSTIMKKERMHNGVQLYSLPTQQQTKDNKDLFFKCTICEDAPSMSSIGGMRNHYATHIRNKAEAPSSFSSEREAETFAANPGAAGLLFVAPQYQEALQWIKENGAMLKGRVVYPLPVEFAAPSSKLGIGSSSSRWLDLSVRGAASPSPSLSLTLLHY